MLDFMKVSTRNPKKDTLVVYPKFLVGKRKDLMIRGGDFYAIWDEAQKVWSTDEDDALRLIDIELENYAKEHESIFKEYVNVLVSYMWDADSGTIDRWHKYCQKQQRDNYHVLDEVVLFSNDEITKESYASKRLSYPLKKGRITSYNKLMSVLYDEEERHKIEWAIGSIIVGDSKDIQKFVVLYGSAGTGKSTVLNIIQELFEGYYSTFEAKVLGQASNAFALEAFKSNPLVAIDHDGDLSRIEDNTRLNSLVSHEQMMVNEKFKSAYSTRFNSFLFMGTNKPVKITDSRSGLMRRLIDVSPTGRTIPINDYKEWMKAIEFELGAIAYHCKEVYLKDPGHYDHYIPVNMIGASNDFYNYIIDNYSKFYKEDGVTLSLAWDLYKRYCEYSNVPEYARLSRMKFKEELKDYFWDYSDRVYLKDGSRVRNYYSKFRVDKFKSEKKPEGKIEKNKMKLIEFKEQESIFDEQCMDCVAQYATKNETPKKKWVDVDTKLKDLDTSKIHFVRVPENHIVIDFDIKNDNGDKDFDLNLNEASKWPATYAELSKGGAGIHLHYIYSGDPTTLSRIYADNIEIKVFTGKSSLRRKLTKCNDLPIASISSGLPLKGGKKMVNFDTLKNEKAIRTLIKKNLRKEIHGATKPSVDFIYKILEDAHESDLSYDVSDMANDIFAFAASSTNQAPACIRLANKMQFKSEDKSKNIEKDSPIAFYDIEVFPNLFLVNWKLEGDKNKVVRMINPSPEEIEELVKYRLIGFNCRRYDNHILYARMMGYTNEQLYNLSAKIIEGNKNAFFGEAYNLSYTDVYDFSVKKQSLKKWEIELGIHHQELGLPWDQPVDEKLWPKVAEYCDNDVIATEKVWEARQADFVTRQIQVDLAKILHNASATVNDTTNSLSTKIIFGNNRKPQSVFNYRDLSEPVGADQYEEYREKFGPDYKFRIFDCNGLPTYEDYDPKKELLYSFSILPFFPKYKFDLGKSTYLDEEIGEGGRVYSEPGMYQNVWDGDVASMHPHSAIYEMIFGPEYTQTFKDIVDARVAIKHKNFDKAGSLLGGALKPYLNDEQADDLAQALKIVINSIYGLTSASFDNPFRDPHNIDNIVAKRGALFMTLLKQQVQSKGYTVAHIKTDSIKIPDADDEIKDFIIKFGREFGYEFETEANFKKFCLVNDAVYAALDEKDNWHTVGKQFQVPYVRKTLFTKEKIEFDDMCETFAVLKGDLYLDMNEDLKDVTDLEKELKALEKDNENPNRQEELKKMIDKNHKYIFIGRVGRFTPVKDGVGGGQLARIKDGKAYAPPGSKGFRWLESEAVKKMKKKTCIDKSFYTKLVDDAFDTLKEFGDAEWFIS